MKARIIIQDAINTMRVTLKLQRHDVTQPEFMLDADIFLNDCFIDGKPYEINLFSHLMDGRRHYKLPVFLSSLELRYDAKLIRDTKGRMILSDEMGWLPVWPDSDNIREFEIHYPQECRLITNYQSTTLPVKDGVSLKRLIGQGRCLIVLGRFIRRIHFFHRYYLTEDYDVELFDKFMRETKLNLEQDWGKSDAMSDHFVEFDQPLHDNKITAVTKQELLNFHHMPQALSRVIESAYPVEFGDYFGLFRRPFYDYLAWRALRGVMSSSEQAKLIPDTRNGRGPLVEQTQLSIEGMAFFKALEETVGQVNFVSIIRQVFQTHRSSPLSLVHFINLFGRDEASRQMLERWLFMGH